MTWPPRWSSLNTDPDRHLTYDQWHEKYGEQEESNDERS